MTDAIQKLMDDPNISPDFKLGLSDPNNPYPIRVAKHKMDINKEQTLEEVFAALEVNHEDDLADFLDEYFIPMLHDPYLAETVERKIIKLRGE